MAIEVLVNTNRYYYSIAIEWRWSSNGGVNSRNRTGPKVVRDRCFRPPVKYNDQYDPFKPPNDQNKAEYSPYDFGEPLFDDREVIIARIPAGHVVTGASKKKKSSWT